MNKLRTLLNGILAILIAALFLVTWNGWITYKAGFNLVEYILRALFVAALLRASIEVDWKKHARERSQSAIAGSVLTIGTVILLALGIVFVNIPHAHEAEIVTRAAFGNSTDQETRSAILEHKNYYPAESFVQRALEQIPEDAAIAYIGDQRGHVLSYQLYPRRLYALPALQEELNLTIQEGWDWMRITDPFRPRLTPTDDPLPAFDNSVALDFRAMIEEKGISWLIVYDSLHPEQSIITKLAAP